MLIDSSDHDLTLLNEASSCGRYAIIDKELIKWCIKEIFNNSCYERGFGVFDKRYGLLLNCKEMDEIKQLIEGAKFPNEYYQLCDLIGEEYVYW